MIGEALREVARDVRAPLASVADGVEELAGRRVLGNVGAGAELKRWPIAATLGFFIAMSVWIALRPQPVSRVSS